MRYCSDCNSYHVGDCPKTRNQFSFLNSTPRWEPLEPIIPRYNPLPPPFDPYRFPMPPPPLPEPPPIIMPPMPDYGPPQSTPEVWQPGYTPYTPNFG